MAEDLMVDDLEESDEQDESKLKELQKKLIDKCKDAKIKAEIKDFSDGDTYVYVSMPNGRDKRKVSFRTIESINSAIELNFEKYIFLGDYVAIANYEDNTIEAIIRPINGMPRNFLFRRIFIENEESEEPQSIILKQDADEKSVVVEISEASTIIRQLVRGPFGRSGSLSIKITGVTISQHDQSLEILKRITDSLFFQIDLQNGLALSLMKDRRAVRKPGRRKPETELDLEFPKVEFDEGPISLYWYARSALGMPLLQFLAYYQVIEYYFPTYSQEEARRRIRYLLKDPTFRSDKDADIGKVLSVVSGTGRGFGNERSQLRATINACLDSIDIRNFLTEYEERIQFFSANQKGLTDYKIPLANKDADLRTPVADLIYDIRCKIVHTKGESIDGDVELLLPFSKEAELLFQDIELMQYVARKVLVAASAPLTL
ncbi:MAG: hypothetical protein VSS75_022175 [Candidatus Parabeggiatoa sp.]|nr:hypothetical protein [Candidatus Parabeggiatoa sp.]